MKGIDLLCVFPFSREQEKQKYYLYGLKKNRKRPDNKVLKETNDFIKYGWLRARKI